MPKTQTKKKDRQKNLKLTALGALIVVLVGILAYALVQSYSHPSNTQNTGTGTSQQQPATSEADAKREAGIILSKVKMEMTKDEVIAVVGQPHSCSSKRLSEEGNSFAMERCSYGKKDAPGHASVVFMNGKVWGTSYESGSIYTDVRY